MLGRKQSVRNNEDWKNALDHIEETVPKKELDSLVKKTVKDIKEKCKGKKAAYAWSAGKDSLVLGEICEKAGIDQSVLVRCNDAIEVGAAAGDTSATWQNYANQIWKNGSDELKASLTDPSNPMYETVRSQLPPELAEAIDRAAAETTTDDVTLEGLKASVDGDVDIDKDAWTSKLNEALGDLGETQEVTADHVKIKVDQGDCLWEIGNALGIDWQTIAEQNGIESPYIIHPDQAYYFRCGSQWCKSVSDDDVKNQQPHD